MKAAPYFFGIVLACAGLSGLVLADNLSVRHPPPAAQAPARD